MVKIPLCSVGWGWGEMLENWMMLEVNQKVLPGWGIGMSQETPEFFTEKNGIPQYFSYVYDGIVRGEWSQPPQCSVGYAVILFIYFFRGRPNRFEILEFQLLLSVHFLFFVSLIIILFSPLYIYIYIYMFCVWANCFKNVVLKSSEWSNTG